ELLRRALNDKERGLGDHHIDASDDVLFRIASYANGDARSAYNTLELSAKSAAPADSADLAKPSMARSPAVAGSQAKAGRQITRDLLEDVLQRNLLRYDKSGEEHFNLISALHKSVRNSDPDAALYWLTRMIESGEDPLYLARRMVRMASEDI